MSRGVRQEKDLREKTQSLLEGPLKHVKAAALAAALLPLASVTPAAAQEACVDPSPDVPSRPRSREGHPSTRPSISIALRCLCPAALRNQRSAIARLRRTPSPSR